ncbi:16S rRNA (guanine(527)-N(7))-methyltransferase RsmG [Mediterraneibacter glycyrrhizinilyticus]|nr:16S rRNA (guanine(527)-N(7))-methyltransferase RsmG [Mediterraneibacter glycyrrhizinilyticus]MBM6853528.1 16S rRNA (guanine(527)-N(7))-methyltransferase RsmG [Mediterraneibacter glycyrrhizinilyticus]
MENEFEKGLKELGITLSSEQREQFDKYYELLVEWNKVMNLTGITEYDEVNLKHFIDSLSIVRVIDMNSVKRMVDVGTGAGFPGIPLKIAFPDTEILLLDSLNKRVKFLNEVISQLGLKKITAVHGRAEELAKNKSYREGFDLCVSRAVANLSTLCEYSLPFVWISGSFVSYKGEYSENEIHQAENAVDILGGKISKIDKFKLPGTDMGRSLIKIDKIKKTPGKYPRKAGLPAKEPLISA